MTGEFFKEQIQRLKSRFGDKAFDRVFCDIVASQVKFMSEQSFVALVNNLIGSRPPNKPPLLEDFAKSVGSAKREQKVFALGDHQPLADAACKDCLDSGFIRLVRKERYETWAKWRVGSAPCHCGRGRQVIEVGRRMKSPHDFGPQFNDRWLVSYDMIPPPLPAITRKPQPQADRGPEEGA